MKRTMIALLVALTLGSGMNLSARDKKTNNVAPTDRKELLSLNSTTTRKRGSYLFMLNIKTPYVL